MAEGPAIPDRVRAGGDPGFGISVALVLVTAFTFAVSVSTPPHSGLAFAWMAAAFPGRGGLERGIRWTFRVGGILVFAAFAGISLAYGLRRDYRFELAVISIDWLVLLIAGTLSALHFRRTAAKGGKADEKA